MKKIILAIIFLPLFFFFSTPAVRADVIPPRSVEYCARFVNTDDFPDYFFLQVNLDKWRTDELYEIIQDDSCLRLAGYENEYRFYAVKKESLQRSKLDYDPPSYYEYLQSLSTEQQDYLKELLDGAPTQPWTDQKLKRKAVVALYVRSNKDLLPFNPGLRIISVDDSFALDPLNSVEERIRLEQNYQGFSARKEIIGERAKSGKHLTTSGRLDLRYLTAFLATFLVELVLLGALLKKIDRELIGKTLVINLATQPIAWFVLNQYFGFYSTEILVAIVEGFMIHWLFRLSYKRGFLYSIIINGATAILGLLLLG